MLTLLELISTWLRAANLSAASKPDYEAPSSSRRPETGSPAKARCREIAEERVSGMMKSRARWRNNKPAGLGVPAITGEGA